MSASKSDVLPRKQPSSRLLIFFFDGGNWQLLRHIVISHIGERGEDEGGRDMTFIDRQKRLITCSSSDMKVPLHISNCFSSLRF